MSFAHALEFVKQFVAEPRVVGALTPSSHSLAVALCEPYLAHKGQARVLEVGAGTGAITRHIGSVLREGDELDIFEIQPAFADILERDVLTLPELRRSVAEGRVRLMRGAVEKIQAKAHYDFVISGLPHTSFALGQLQEVFAVIRRCLKPGGVFTYYEYIALRRLGAAFSIGAVRRRRREVSRFLWENIQAHQFARRIVMSNLPPARARHLRFDPPGGTATVPGSSRIAAEG